MSTPKDAAAASQNDQKKGKQKGQQEKKPPREWTDELQVDLERLLTVGEECVLEADLKKLLLAKGRGSGHPSGFILYDGFEPSGRMHIAQGVFKAMNVNKCTAEGSGGTFVFWVADWFALMNDKMGGDIEKIKIVGQYLIEVWKAAGMNLDHVVFKWASEEITNNANVYWPTMLDVARRFNLTRIKKCCQIMGRLEGNLTAAQILYPIMQCTDVYFLKADICQLGVDQRKVNMLAREYADIANFKNKPVILSHHMLYGLKAGQEKMSKSDPDSAVFMEDAPEDVERKILNAYCPDKEQEPESAAGEEPEDAGKQSMQLKEDRLKNPCLDYIQNIIFSPPGATFTSGGQTYDNFEQVRADFLAHTISEEDLKRGLIDELNRLLDPVRNHFTNDPNAKQLLAQVQQFKRDATAPTDKVVRRLNQVELEQVPKDSHVVFAPLPSANPTLQGAMDVLAQLRQGEGKPGVVFLSDWTARVCSACQADTKAISAFYSVFVAALKALDPTLMETTKIILQSEAILMDPSNYWISVINVGRHFQLADVMGELEDKDAAGIVVGRLMQVADIMGLEPASLSLTSGENDSDVVKSLVSSFFSEKVPSLQIPTVHFGKAPSLELQQRALEAHKTDNDEYYLLDDPKVHGKSKMKKAFCEPGNIDYCPPISVAAAFSFESGNGEIMIKRSPENGGDVVYHNTADMEKDFASGALHPGDLKAATTAIMVETLTKLSSAIKQDGDAQKGSKALKAFQKRMAKSKKK